MGPVAEGLDVAVSELHRMRWFAHLITTGGESSFWDGVPDGRHTWTKVKEILPSLVGRKHTTERKASASGKKKVAVMSGVLKMMGSAVSKLRSGNREIDDAEKGKLLAKLKDFVSAISASTGLHLSVTEDAVQECG